MHFANVPRFGFARRVITGASFVITKTLCKVLHVLKI